MLKRDEGNYVMRLTDGYVDSRAYDHSITNNAARTDERMLGDEILRLANRSYLTEKEGLKRLDALHVWVIGANGWLTRAPKLLRSLAEYDPNDAYRIVMVGEDITGIQRPHITDWTTWLRSAGMNRRKRHEDHQAFKEVGNTLLDMLQDHYHSNHEPPTNILERFDVPICYSGYGPSNADSVLS